MIPTIVEYTQRGFNSSEKGGISPFEEGGKGGNSPLKGISPFEEGGKGGNSPLKGISPFEEGGKGGSSPLYFQQNIGDQVHAFWSLPNASYFVEL